MSNLGTDNIYWAIEALAREAERLSWTAQGWEQRDRAKSLQQTARDAQAEYRALSEKLPRMRELLASSAREYDRYVTRDRFEVESCSCHISAPCSYCTREADEEEEFPQPAADQSSPAPVDSHNHGPDSTNSCADAVGEREET